MSKQKSYIGIKNEAETSTLELHFTDFIYDGFDWDTWETTNLVQETINKIKDANPSKIKVVINSLGGDVMIGLALYNYIKNYKAEKEVDIIGFAASIASIMAMVADKGKLRMAKSSFMIIHAAWSYAVGNAKDMRKQAEDLDKVTNELASIYAERTGKEASYFTDLWADGDYWMTGTEAKELGLADELYNAEPINAKVDFSAFNFKNVPAAFLKNDADPEDNKSFFTNLNEQFMKFFDTLKASVTGAKGDKKFDKVENRDAILDMVQDVLKPFAEALDEKAKEEDKPAEEKPAEEKPAVEKPTETETTPAENKTLLDLQARLDKMEKENEKLRNSLAAQTTKPESDKPKNSSTSKIKVEYEN